MPEPTYPAPMAKFYLPPPPPLSRNPEIRGKQPLRLMPMLRRIPSSITLPTTTAPPTGTDYHMLPTLTDMATTLPTTTLMPPDAEITKDLLYHVMDKENPAVLSYVTKITLLKLQITIQ